MPKVFDKATHGYDGFIYTRGEHGPAHIHVRLGGREAVIELDPIRVRDNWGFHDRDLSKVMTLVQEHQDRLLAVWDSLFPSR